jgi:hypothetical protein
VEKAKDRYPSLNSENNHYRVQYAHMDGQQPQSDEQQWQFNPGETISPRQTSVPSEPTPQPANPETPAQVAAQPSQTTVAPPLAVTPSAPPDQAAAPVSEAPQPQLEVQTPSLTWSASEFVSRQKSGAWYTLVIIVFLAVAIGAWFMFHDIVSAIVIVLAGVALSYYGAHKPRQVEYEINHEGISIGQKHFQFSEFKAFSIVPEGAFETVQLIPTKRFLPMTTLFFDPQDGDKIIDILGSHLPHQERKADAIDNLMRKIKF